MQHADGRLHQVGQQKTRAVLIPQRIRHEARAGRAAEQCVKVGRCAHVVSPLLKEIGQMQISEEKARKDWGWEIAYNLDEMVDDFIQEFHRRSSDGHQRLT